MRSDGIAYTTAAQLEGVSHNAASDWLKRHPELKANVQAAQLHLRTQLAEKVQKAALEGAKTIVEKTRYDASGKPIESEKTVSTDDGIKYSQWLLARLDPENYSEKGKIEKLAQKRFSELLQYLLAGVSDVARAEIESHLLIAGIKVKPIEFSE
ncbi:hypothetical protein LEP3755_30620 [Leptolyngbya sp. NIES-3755]|nr:hypothetical protein LEP3755_30620 [Leptolyngbya sp. NIES-3755]